MPNDELPNRRLQLIGFLDDKATDATDAISDMFFIYALLSDEERDDVKLAALHNVQASFEGLVINLKKAARLIR